MAREENRKIRTMIVEDEEKILAHISHKILALDPSFEIIGTAGNGEEALEKVEQLRPQVVFTDISMPVMNGMELIKRIKRIDPSTIIVIISGYSNFTYAQQAIKYGVSNYLLKPLEEDALAETLFDIKKSCTYLRIKKQRHMMCSENYKLLPDQMEEFMIAVICMGNIIYSIQDEEVTRFYGEQIEQISWNKIINELYGEIEWFIADDYMLNQKVIGIKTDYIADFPYSDFARDLSNAIQKETTLPVSVCCVKHTIRQEELWDYTKRLRNVIKKNLIIGESRIFYLEEAEKNRDDMTEIIKLKLNMFTKKYVIGQEPENFMNEIKDIFKYMRNNHATQESIEKICIYLLKLLELSNQGYEREMLEGLQEQMMKDISLSVSEEELFERLMQLFGTVLNKEEIDEEKDKEKILEYVDANYLTIESLTEVAERFGYNYAYLSRMFKKKEGESLSRYIMNKKIEHAKEMLINESELKVTEVSALCGYNDYRYFCKVFKNEVGISPGNYKKSHCSHKEV